MAGLFIILFFAALAGVFKPYIKGTKRWQFGVGAFLAFIMVGAFSETSATNDTNDKPVASTERPTDGEPTEGVISAPNDADARNVAAPDTPSDRETAEISEMAPKEPVSNWQYSTSKDEMRGTESRYAQLNGSNTINLDFPYGEQRGRILVRQSSQFGFDILVGVNSGQIMCSSYSRSFVNVKFDDGPIERYGCNDASDGTSNLIFIEGAKGFLRKLKKSKRVIVEAEFFQNGMQQMMFETAGLKWES